MDVGACAGAAAALLFCFPGVLVIALIALREWGRALTEPRSRIPADAGRHFSEGPPPAHGKGDNIQHRDAYHHG